MSEGLGSQRLPKELEEAFQRVTKEHSAAIEEALAGMHRSPESHFNDYHEMVSQDPSLPPILPLLLLTSNHLVTLIVANCGIRPVHVPASVLMSDPIRFRGVVMANGLPISYTHVALAMSGDPVRLGGADDWSLNEFLEFELSNDPDISPSSLREGRVLVSLGFEIDGCHYQVYCPVSTADPW